MAGAMFAANGSDTDTMEYKSFHQNHLTCGPVNVARPQKASSDSDDTGTKKDATNEKLL